MSRFTRGRPYRTNLPKGGANFLCRWAVQELVEFAVRNEVSLGKLLTPATFPGTGARTGLAHDPLARWHTVDEAKRESMRPCVLSLTGPVPIRESPRLRISLTGDK
jgi:hypothetical protein